MSGNVNLRPNVLNLAERTSVSSKKTVRAPLTKKRSKGVPLSERVTLERVLGFTVKDNRTFACDPNTGLIVYPAGCVIVLFNPRRNKQSHIFNHSRKTITSLAISGDGKNIVSGECGHKPAVRVWDVEDRTQLAEFHGHKFGINCVAFSPNLKYVISVGEQHDMVVNVWDWKSGSKHGTGKISAKVTGLAFSEDGSRFVTVGNRSVRFWYMAIKSKTRETVPLNSRSGILGEQRNNFFCSVACGLGVNQSKTYAVTKSGLLCEFSEQRLLDKWVELRTTNAYCIVATDEHLFVGCTDGIVRLFSASTLNFVATLPRPHFLGVNVSAGIDPSHMITHSEEARFPAVRAITCDDVNKKITCIYNDHSMYVWDIRDVKKIGKQRSFLYHSSCIWGAEVYPSLAESDKAALPPGSFLTYASDDTIRIWNVDPAMNTDTFKRNIYSNELLKIIYVDDQLENLCNVGGSSSAASDKGDSVEGKNGIRCVSISSDGQLLASGDRSGNVRVHDMQFMDEVHKIEAHDSEVLCLEFSRPESGYNLLCSASRDRLIHVFNMQEDCSLVQTIDDHSSSITAVKFTQSNGRLQMISCGADKALMFRVVTQNPDFEFIRNHHVVGKTTIYDLTIDPMEKYVATACQDRNIRIHNAVTGKLKRTYKGSLAEDGTLIRVEVDPSGMYIATSCSDKSVAIFDFYSGECVATMDGHSELVTGIKFTNDCKHLISTSGDGCIFVWRLPWGFTHNMKERLSEIGQHMKKTPEYPLLSRRGTYVVPPELMGDPSAVATETRHNSINNSRAMASVKGSTNYPVEAEIIDEQEDDDDEEEEEDQPDWQAKPKLQSTADLPLWAKKQVCGEDLPSPTTYSNPTQPRGRWAQRLDSKGFKVKSEWDAHRDIELKMEECIDRRRYTVEPEALADQVRHFALLHSAALAEAEKIQNSLTIDEVEEFVSAEEGLAGLEEQVNVSNPLLQGFVTSSRGSDPFLPPSSHPSDALMSPDTPDDDQGSTKLDDEAEEEEEEEANDVIIYPPSEESNASPESLKFQVTESTSSMEELQRRRARSFIKHEQKEKESPRSSRVIQDEDLAKVEGSESNDPVSLGTSEDEDDEEDEVEAEEDSKPSMEDDPSSTSPSTSGNNTESAPTSQDSPSPDQDKDEESFLHTNFTFAEKEKFGKCLEQLQSGFASVGISNGNHHRLSISSKFLSRSQSSHLKSLSSSIHKMPTSSVGGVTAQVYLQRRKDVMARAVDETRRRLQSMGWKSLSISSKSTTSSSSSSTATTTPVLTPTSPKKSLHTSNQEHSKEESPPVKIDEVEVAQNPAESTEFKAQVLNERNAPLENINNGQDSQKLADTVEAKTDSRQISHEISDVNKQGAIKENFIVTEESGQIVEDGGCKEKLESNKNIETKELQMANKDISSCDQSDTTLSALTDDSVQASLDVKEVSESDMNVLADVSISRPSSRSESIASSDSQSSVITSTSEHLPIIKGKRSSTRDTAEAVEKANKENLERTSKYESHQSRRSISSSSRSKVERMKARKEQASVITMRKTTSMSDLREASKDEDERTESPTFSIVLKTHPRSHSMERKPIRANSPAREKHRARSERVLPNVSNLLKPKSYEIGTTSSRAKKSTRKESDTPPSSPSRVKRKKRASLGGPVEGAKPSKSEETSPEAESVTAKFTRVGDAQSAKDSLVEKTQQQSESAAELTDKASKDQPIKEVASQIDSNQISDGLAVARSNSPQLNSDTSSQKDTDLKCEDIADALAMPPPRSTTVGKSSRTSRRSSASKAVDELRQRKRSSSNTPPPTNENATPGDQKSSSDSISASDTSQVDSKHSPSSRRKVAAYREKRSNSLNLSMRSSSPRSSSPRPTSPRPSSPRPLSPRPASPHSARKGSAPVIKVEFKQNGESPKKELEKPSPRRRRREKSESSETNVSNNNNTHSPRTQTRRRRSSPGNEPAERSSSPRVDHLDREVLEATEATSEFAQGAQPQDQCKSPGIRVPSPEGGSPTLTFDMMKAKVDTMKTAFDQCLDLCYQIRCTQVEDQQHFFNYFNSTLSQMQAATSIVSSTRQTNRLLNPSVTTDDTMSDVSESSLPFDEVPQSFSSGLPMTRQSVVSPTDINALKSSLASCKRTPANGITAEGETTSAVALLDHYSDILVSLVRQKMGDEVSEGTTTTETQQTLEPAL